MFTLRNIRNVSLLFLIFLCWFFQPFSTPIKSYASSSVNLLQNPSFDENTSGWWSPNNIFRDTAIFRGQSGASIKLSESNLIKAGAIGESIHVIPGKYYTFRAFARSATLLSNPKLTIWTYNSTGKCINWRHESFSLSTLNKWQEIVVEYKAPENASRLILVISNGLDGILAPIWVDDIFFGEGQLGLENPPSNKVPFNGHRVRVDSEGNFEIYKNNTWKPFFPFGLVNNTIITVAKAQELSDQGFNLSFPKYPPHLANLKNATSKFNPDGMMAMIPAGMYYHNDLPSLKNYVNSMISSPNNDTILTWYDEPTDANRKLRDYDNAKQVYDIIRQQDQIKNIPGSPVFLSFGEIGYARAFSNATNISGTFRYPLGSNISSIPISSLGSIFKTAKNLEGTIKPHSIVTIQATDYGSVTKPTPQQLKSMVYEAIWGGARGIIFWWEQQDNNKLLKDTDIWPIIPQIRSEIDTLLPILRSSDPLWKVNVNPKSAPRVDILKKEYKKEPYILLVNTEKSTANLSLYFSDLPFRPVKVEDIFTKKSVNLSENSFNTTLKPFETRVYRVIKPANVKPKVVKPDNTNPIVSILRPLNNFIKGDVDISSTATDNKGISKIEQYIDGSLKSTSKSASLSFTWNTKISSNGPHILKIVAYDTSDNTSEYIKFINVDNYKPKTYARKTSARKLSKKKAPRYLRLYRHYRKKYGKTRNRALKKRYYRAAKKYHRLYNNAKKGIATAKLRWYVKDPYTANKAYVTLKIQKKIKSRLKVKRKARYLKTYRKYRAKYLADKNKYRKTRNRTLRRRHQRAAARYKKAMRKYLRAYRRTKTVVYKTVKTVRYRWTSINKWRTYTYRTRRKGVYRYLVYAKDKAGNKQYNVAKNVCG